MEAQLSTEFGKEQREELFLQWAILPGSARRKRQLISRLWSPDTLRWHTILPSAQKMGEPPSLISCPHEAWVTSKCLLLVNAHSKTSTLPVVRHAWVASSDDAHS